MIDRRSFVRIGGVAAASTILAERVFADPYATKIAVAPARRAVRVRGMVRGSGTGLSNVRITDGIQVVATGRDGSYEMVTSADREFITASPPAGFAFPTSSTGTAAGYHRLSPEGGDEMTALFEFERLPEPDDDHVMMLLPDIQTENRMEMNWFHEQAVPDLVRTVESLGDQNIFGISCGDIMFDDLSLYPEYERGVKQIGVPFFQVVGNHDLDQQNGTDETSTTTFARYFGPRYRSFDRGAVHYVVLDDVFWHGAGYLGYLGDDQLTWLANDLRFVEPGRPVIVATHIPVLGTGHTRRGERSPGLGTSVANREMLYRLLEPYQAHILCGHTHENDHNRQNGVHEHVSGTVCGAWWSGPICGDGTPNGYALYEIRGEEITWRYKATGQDADHQIRTYAPGADPNAPGAFVANVWDWDESWSVAWYENGERRGSMNSRIALDPLSVELHSGPDLPPRRTWVEPYPTRHLFYAAAPDSARDIRVEATDPFGRTYSAAVPLS